MAKYQIPETYEEAIQRKEEILKLMGEYNEAIFAGKEELPLTEEEVNSLQEEYSLLDEYVDLAPTEKKQLKKLEKVEYVEVKQEDGTTKKVEKVTFWDKVNPAIFIYAVFPLLGSFWYAIRGIGVQVLNLFIKISNKNQWTFDSWTDGQINALFSGLLSIYPILFLLVTFFIARFACRKKETKLVGYIILAAQFVILLINFIFVNIDLQLW